MAKRNWVDNLIGYFSPEAGLRRAKARMAAEIIDQRHYEGASTGRRTDGWISTSNNANGDIGAAIVKLRERSRDLNRNNAIAARATQVIVSNTIGYGIKTNYASKGVQSQNHNELWKAWADTKQCDFDGQRDIYGLQALAMRTLVESGAVLIRRIRLTAAEKGVVPFKVQILEPDFIDLTKDKTEGNIQGVKFDSKGKLVGYWLYKNHPGDTSNPSTESVLVPASEVAMMFRADRPGQVHGVPWAHPVMVTLKELDEYLDASLVKQKVSAAFAAFVHDIEGVADGSGKKAPIGEVLEPGVIEVLPNGKDIRFANPPTVGDFDPFIRINLRIISSGYGITYEALAGDLSGVNFSSGRMGWLEFQRNIDSWRWHIFIPQFCDTISSWFVESANLIGVKMPEGLRAVHTPPRREMIDLTGETNALINAARAGIKSLRQIHLELGEDHEEVLKEISQTNKLIDKYELILDSDPRRVMKAGIVQSGINASAIGDTESVEKDTNNA